LRTIADELHALRGFSTTSPVRIPLTAPLDLTSITAASLLFFERTDGALDLDGLVSAAEQRGVERADIALAISFPTQRIGADLRAIRALLIERASVSPPRLELSDEEPDDDLNVGVFTHANPGMFADFLAGSVDVALLAHGLMRSPSFLGADGRLDPSRVIGDGALEEVALDVVITVPVGNGPFPVVILQHGFGGSNLAMLPNAALLAARGIATAAISAMQHGRRGSPVALLDSTPLQTRDIFRQSNSDQMQLVRLIESGVDLDADGDVDLAPAGIGYHGVSLGGLLGANLIAVEDAITTAVLTVAGGRIAGLGQAPSVRPLYAQFFADRAGLPVDSTEFATVLDRLLELGQLGMDDGDGLNYARFWHREPFAGSAKRVLLQEGIGDDWVLNEHTEELAHAAGIAAQVEVTDTDGVCGLWRFDPPDPPQGHGISARPEVRAQAVRFLASGGTEISED
jgi:dienelactone hydrolase